jgi:hypothetical protein
MHRAPARLRLLIMPGVGGLTTPQLRPLMVAAWQRKFGRPPTLAEYQSWACIVRFDGGNGNWPAGSSMEGSHNMGGVQAPGLNTSGPGWHAVPFASFEIVKGRRVDYPAEPFKFYDSWELGIADQLDNVTAPKRPLTGAALATGSLWNVASKMHLEHYFTADPGDYARALWAQAKPIATMTGQPLAVRLGSPADLGSSASSGSGWALLFVAGAVLAWELGAFD